MDGPKSFEQYCSSNEFRPSNVIQLSDVQSRNNENKTNSIFPNYSPVPNSERDITNIKQSYYIRSNVLRSQTNVVHQQQQNYFNNGTLSNVKFEHLRSLVGQLGAQNSDTTTNNKKYPTLIPPLIDDGNLDNEFKQILNKYLYEDSKSIEKSGIKKDERRFTDLDDNHKALLLKMNTKLNTIDSNFDLSSGPRYINVNLPIFSGIVERHRSIHEIHDHEFMSRLTNSNSHKEDTLNSLHQVKISNNQILPGPIFSQNHSKGIQSNDRKVEKIDLNQISHTNENDSSRQSFISKVSNTSDLLPRMNDDNFNQSLTQSDVTLKTELKRSKPRARIGKTTRTESGNKKYICKICSKELTTSGHLSRHYRIHTGEKKHICPFEGCTLKFSRQDNCVQHYRTHLKKKVKK